MDIEQIFRNLKSADHIEKVVANTEQTAVILNDERDESTFFRVSVLDTVENLLNEISVYGTEVRDILSSIALSTELLPDLIHEAQTEDRTLALEYLDLIESNTRALATIPDGEGAVGANQLSTIMDSVSVSITGSLMDQTNILSSLLENSNYERDLIEKEEDSFEEDYLPEEKENRKSSSDGGMFGFLGGLAQGWKKLPMGIKALGKGGLLAAGLVGTGFFIKNLYDTFNDEEKLREISGNAKGILTGAEQSSATIASAVSALTAGLLDSKDVYNFIYGGVKGIQDFIDEIFDPDEGILGQFTTGVFNLIDNWDFSAFTDSIIESLMEFPQRVIEKFTQWWGNLTNLTENLFGKGFNDSVKSITGFATDKLSSAMDWVTGGISNFTGGDESSKVVTANEVVSSPANRSIESRSSQLSKERFDRSNNTNPTVQSAPVVQSSNVNNYSTVIRDDSFAKQLQLLGI